MAVEVVPAAFRPVDVPVDRLVADRRAALPRLLLQPAGDLLRRPAGLQPPDHVRAQGIVSDQLPAPLSATARQVLRGQGEVAAEPAVAIAEAVAAQLAVDGREVAAKPGRDLTDWPTGLDQAEEGAALVEIELLVDSGQRRLRSAGLYKGWPFALRDRIHRAGLDSQGYEIAVSALAGS